MDTIKLRRIDLRGRLSDLAEVIPRAELDIGAASAVVGPILEQVRTGDEQTLLDIAEKFEGVRPRALRVPREVIEGAVAALDANVRVALEESIKRVRLVHRRQRPSEVVTDVAPGARITDRWVPVDRVGLYVPGGRAIYVSSVVMNVVPAQEAGVVSLAIASPPQRDNGGWPHPTVLAAASILGVDEVYAAGGAQAVAMFAYGVNDAQGVIVCPKVAMVTGPGNVYVAAAKRMLRGTIGIDSEAGPTEVAILADETADAGCVAADLISQAEHDPLAASVLVTDSLVLADAVDTEVARRVALAKHSARAGEALAGVQSGIILVDDIAAGVEVVNAYAAEHLEVQTRDSWAVAQGVRNAGAVFVGTHAPVSLGDYIAGSNHVLPTGGSAVFNSGLSVQTFLKGVQFIEYDADALREVADRLQHLALAEDLPAHSEAVQARFPG